MKNGISNSVKLKMCSCFKFYWQISIFVGLKIRTFILAIMMNINSAIREKRDCESSEASMQIVAYNESHFSASKLPLFFALQFSVQYRLIVDLFVRIVCVLCAWLRHRQSLCWLLILCHLVLACKQCLKWEFGWGGAKKMSILVQARQNNFPSDFP